jgi:plasmid stabilization system protein ParE
VAPESEILGEELRHYIYKLHRIIFRIEEKAKIVRIVHVRHSARLPLGQEGPDPDKE